MKKHLLLMLALLCTTLTVWAERVTDLSQLSNDKVYFIQGDRPAFLMYSDKLPDVICTNNGSKVGTVTADLHDPNQQFRIEKDGEMYYLFSEGAGKYVGANGAYTASPTVALNIMPSGDATYPWHLRIGSQGMNTQKPGQTESGILVDGWTHIGEGNIFYIEEAIPATKDYTIKVLGTDDANAGIVYGGQLYKDGAVLSTTDVLKAAKMKAADVKNTIPVVNIYGLTIYVSYFAGDTKFYTIHNDEGGYMSLAEGYTDADGYLLLSNTDEARDRKGLWAFVGTETGKYHIYNYSMGLTRLLGQTGAGTTTRTAMVDTDNTTYKTVFSGTINLGSSNPSYIKVDGVNKWWSKRGDYLASRTIESAEGDVACMFYITEADHNDLPDNYLPEVKDISGVTSFSPKNPNTLWYKVPAKATGVSNPWMEYALPLGNGELGCMVFGGIYKEEIQFNEKTLWKGNENVVGAGSGDRTFMNFGSVHVENLDKAIWQGVTDYVRYLDIEEGIAGVEFRNGNGSKFTRKYLSSAPAGVIAGHYTAEGNDKMNLNFTVEPFGEINAGTVSYRNGVAIFTGQMAIKYAACLRVVADDGAIVICSDKGIRVSNANEVTFYLKGETNFNGDMDATSCFVDESVTTVNLRAKKAIDAAVEKGYEELEAEHIEDFTSITRRMTFDLGLHTPAIDTKALVDNYYPNNPDGSSTDNDHLFLEQLYFHYGRYLAISSNRKAIPAPNNLQGIWNDRGMDSPWNADIHTDVNIQMNYWPTEITNLSDLHLPFLYYIIRGANSAGWKKVAQDYNDGYGWGILAEASLYYSMSTWGSNFLAANVWFTSHLWNHWQYTHDKEFLAKAFPAMWSCAQFWMHRLIEDRGYDSATQNSSYSPAYSFKPDGTYVTPNEYSPEQDAHPREDATAYSQQMVSHLLQNISDAISILGVENTGLSTEDVAKLNEYLSKIDKGLHTETYTGTWGATRNGVKTGDVILREWKYSPYDVSNDPGHRHNSHLMALYPLGQITPESEYFTPAVNSLKLRGDAATGWSMGWKVNLWARAQDGDHAHLIMKNALRHSTSYGTDQYAGGIYYNLFDSHAPFQIDGNFGVCSGVAECLLQSAHGYINILPALPTAWHKQGKVTGMKAIGNFTVDFNWANGKCQLATIVSHMGSPLKVRCTRGAMEIAKACITVNGVEVAATVDENGIATIPCEKDDVVVINFTRETGIASAHGTAGQKGDASIYDLSGRRLHNAPTAQVYIQNNTKKMAK